MDNYIEYIFSKDIGQQLRILEILYNSPYPLGTDELTKITNLERRIIHKHLAYIIELANADKEIKASIILEKRKYIFSGDHSEYYALKCALMTPEPLLKLCELFLTNRTIDFSSFCRKHFISESTMRRKILRANILLTSIGNKILLKRNQIYIEGEERIIRYSIVSLLWRVYRGIKWPFNGVNEQKIDTIISSAIPSIKYISYGKRKHLSFYLAVSISRVQSNNVISKELLPDYSEALISSNFSMKKLSQLIKQYFPMPSVELEYISLLFYIFPECYEKFQNTDGTLKLLKKYSHRSYSSMMYFVSFIKKRHPEWDMNHPYSPLFWPTLISGRIFVDIFKNIFFNTSAIQIFKHAKTDYPNLLPTIEKCILTHEPNLPKNTLKSLTLRYGQAYIMEFPPHDFEPKIKILLLTDTATYIDRITKQRIENLLKYRFNFLLETVRSSNLPDLILETGTIKRNFQNVRRLFINPEVTQKDSENILNICNQILNEKLSSRPILS